MPTRSDPRPNRREDPDTLLTRTVQLRFSDEQYEALKHLARHQREPISRVARRLVAFALMLPDDAYVEFDELTPEQARLWWSDFPRTGD